ncbi:MAG: hypothetical protein LBQ50_03320, partial [Planctomycetaceae bacterium]|nr:hypothetical protein [Planctomycetaceae bacterium]
MLPMLPSFIRLNKVLPVSTVIIQQKLLSILAGKFIVTELILTLLTVNHVTVYFVLYKNQKWSKSPLFHLSNL